VEIAVVNPVERDGVVQDLIGYVTLRGGAAASSRTAALPCGSG